MDRSEFAVMLSCSPLFGDLERALLDTLAGLCMARTLPVGATLFRKGDAGDCLYGVRSGRIFIEITSGGGQRVTLATLGAGDLFGEIALLDGKGRTADAVAGEEVRLYALRRSDLLGLIEREPAVAVKLMEVLCQRLRGMSDQIERNMTHRLQARLAGKLLQLAEDYGADIAITQDQLARSANATRESVNRQLRRWEIEGVLRLRRGGVVVEKLEALRVEGES